MPSLRVSSHTETLSTLQDTWCCSKRRCWTWLKLPTTCCSLFQCSSMFSYCGCWTGNLTHLFRMLPHNYIRCVWYVERMQFFTCSKLDKVPVAMDKNENVPEYGFGKDAEGAEHRHLAESMTEVVANWHLDDSWLQKGTIIWFSKPIWQQRSVQQPKLSLQ